MSGPLVSIIIPTFNRAHLIGETLDSVIAQTYQNWECIVVDDGSTDDTAKVMEAYMAKDSRIQYHHRPPEHKPGGNGARNYGFKMSEGEFVNWFDDDDVLLSDFLEFKLKHFTSAIDLVIASGYQWNERINIKKPILLEIRTDLYTDYSLQHSKILTPSVIFRRLFLEDKILFNEDLLRGQETDFFYRIFFKLKLNNVQIKNEFLFLYRLHDNTKSSKNQSYHLPFIPSLLEVYSKNFDRARSIKNKEVAEYSYFRLVNMYFNALHYNDQLHKKIIKKKIKAILYQGNFFGYLELKLLSAYLERVKKGRYYFRKRWRAFNLNNI